MNKRQPLHIPIMAYDSLGLNLLHKDPGTSACCFPDPGPAHQLFPGLRRKPFRIYDLHSHV